MQRTLRRTLAVFASGAALATWAAGADDASVRASAGIRMSRGMDAQAACPPEVQHALLARSTAK
jgi:hypothetical protein